MLTITKLVERRGCSPRQIKLPSIARLKATGNYGLPKVRALYEATYFAGRARPGCRRSDDSFARNYRVECPRRVASGSLNTRSAEVCFRRNLVIAGRSGEGPFTIRFADVRYRALSPVGFWVKL